MEKTIILFLLSLSSLACSVTSAPVVFTTQSANTSSFEFDSCTSEQIDLFNDIVLSSAGTLKEVMLQANPLLSSIQLRPKTIRLRSLEETITSRLNLSGNIQVKVVDNSINSEILKHEEDDFLSVSCNNCDKSGIQNILITRNSGAKKATQWIKVNILKSVRAIVSKTSIGPEYTGIDASKVELKHVYTDKPNDVFGDFEDISLYRANKFIAKDSIIKISDLSPVQLVKPGASVRVKMKFDNLNISTQAISIGGGFMGDEIKVKNEKTHKVFSARVVGVNEVKLDL